jgi:hypothetical protein
MFKFLKSLFGGDKQINQEAGVQIEQVPYKVEPPVVEDKVAVANRAPAKCGCGRSSTGLCVGLHKLSESEWAAHDANPNKAAGSKPAAITAAKKPAAKKPAAKKPAAKKAPAKKKPAK